MNTRKYILAALMTQMISLPILLTVGFLVMVENLPLIPRLRGLGPDTSNLIFLLIYFLSTLFVGGIVGFLFSWRFKHKPDTPKACYLPLIFPIVYALIFATLAVLFAGFDYTSEWWGGLSPEKPSLFDLRIIYFLGGKSFSLSRDGDSGLHRVSHRGTFSGIHIIRISKTCTPFTIF